MIFGNRFDFLMLCRYNTIIQYETLRVAVCEMMEEQRSESKDLPDTLKDAMRGLFVEFVDTYLANCQKLIDRGLQASPRLFVLIFFNILLF